MAKIEKLRPRHLNNAHGERRAEELRARFARASHGASRRQHPVVLTIAVAVAVILVLALLHGVSAA